MSFNPADLLLSMSKPKHEHKPEPKPKPEPKQEVKQQEEVQVKKESRNRKNTTPIDNESPTKIPLSEMPSIKDRPRKCKINKSVRTIYDCQQCDKKKHVQRAACVRDNEIVEA